MWTIEFYEKTSGECPVETFIESIENSKLKAKVLRDIELLETFGNQLRLPFSESIVDDRGSMFELRSKLSNNIARVFYYFKKGKKIILLNGFIKDTQKTPRNEIDKAYLYKKDWEERNRE